MSNNRIKVVRCAHSTAQELRTCAALYAERWAFRTSMRALVLLICVAVPAVFTTPALAQESTEKYLPCANGPTALRLVDKWESENLASNIKDANGKYIAPEKIAEKFIADCAERLSSLVALAETTDDKASRGVAASWRVNLEFMQWWLRNRYDKARGAKAK